jgi:hypothetical protein
MGILLGVTKVSTFKDFAQVGVQHEKDVTAHHAKFHE